MGPMSQLAITVVGRDRPGIIAEATSALASLGVNIEDSTMTLLRGHFAMVLVTGEGPGADAVATALDGLTTDGTLSVEVRLISGGTTSPSGSSYLLRVHGGDRPGIISALVGEVAGVGGNITDLSTRLSGGLYVLLAECDLPGGTDVPALQEAVAAAARRLGVEATLRPVESDEL